MADTCPYCGGGNLVPLYYRDAKRDITGYRGHCRDCNGCGPVISIGGAYMRDWEQAAADSLKAFRPASMVRQATQATKPPAPEFKP